MLIQLLHSCLLTSRWQCVPTSGPHKGHKEYFFCSQKILDFCLSDNATSMRSFVATQILTGPEIVLCAAEVWWPLLTLACVMQWCSMFVCVHLFCFLFHLTALVKVNKHVFQCGASVSLSYSPDAHSRCDIQVGLNQWTELRNCALCNSVLSWQVEGGVSRIFITNLVFSHIPPGPCS